MRVWRRGHGCRKPGEVEVNGGLTLCLTLGSLNRNGGCNILSGWAVKMVDWAKGRIRVLGGLLEKHHKDQFCKFCKSARAAKCNCSKVITRIKIDNVNNPKTQNVLFPYFNNRGPFL